MFRTKKTLHDLHREEDMCMEQAAKLECRSISAHAAEARALPISKEQSSCSTQYPML